MVTPRRCLDRIAMDEPKNGGDSFFDLPNCRFERTAHAVLNPSRDPQFDEFSQLRWLEHHHVDGEDPLKTRPIPKIGSPIPRRAGAPCAIWLPDRRPLPAVTCFSVMS